APWPSCRTPRAGPDLAPGAQRLGHAPRLGDGSPGRKRRVAFEDLGDAAESIVAQVMRHGRQEGTGGLPVPVDPKVGDGKWAEEPSPGRTLVIGAVALGRSAPVSTDVRGLAGG